MKSSSLLYGMAAAVVILAVLLAIFGVDFRGMQGAPRYDPATEIAIKGTIVETQEFTCPVAGELGAHVLVNTGSERFQVHLAPARQLRRYNIRFRPGEQIEVVGSKMSYRGVTGIIARSVTRGDETFRFRDHTGALLLE